MKTTDSFAAWADWYRNYLDRQLPIPWNTFERIPENLKDVIGDSIRIFQLGESSEATNLKAKVARYVKMGGDPAYKEAMEGFIFEENRHARLLGRFMALEGMPKAQAHLSDGFFRLLRHMVSLRHSLVILLSAELIAVPYYKALGELSDSAILTTICKQILLDEANHIQFQSKAIRTMQTGFGKFRQKLIRLQARILLELALDVVWFHHGPLFHAAGWGFGRVRKETLAQFDWAWTMILDVNALPEQSTISDAGEDLGHRSLSRNALWSNTSATNPSTIG